MMVRRRPGPPRIQSTDVDLGKPSEVDNRWRRLRREPRRILSELAPGEVGIDAVPHHGLRETCDSRNGWGNLLVL
jgi:hypothetical protein